MRSHSLLLIACLAALAACQTTPPAPVEVAAPAPPARDVIKELRETAVQKRSQLDVSPLEEPAVTHLIEEALAAESRGDTMTGRQKLNEALRLEPRNPRLWQLLGEMEYREGRTAEAEAHAQKSYSLGSKIGEWCTRNWLLIAEVRGARADKEGAARARATADECPVYAIPSA